MVQSNPYSKKRESFVYVGNFRSKRTRNMREVPQGSILEPLLINISSNHVDLHTDLHRDVSNRPWPYKDAKDKWVDV